MLQLSIPVNKYRMAVFGGCILGFICCLNWFYSIFSIEDLSLKCIALCAVFAIAEVTVMRWLTKGIELLQKKITDFTTVSPQNVG